MEAVQKLVARGEDGLEHRTALVVASSKVRGILTSLELSLRMPDCLQQLQAPLVMTGMFDAVSG